MAAQYMDMVRRLTGQVGINKRSIWAWDRDLPVTGDSSR
jgi:hypothetical protein